MSNEVYVGDPPQIGSRVGYRDAKFFSGAEITGTITGIRWWPHRRWDVMIKWDNEHSGDYAGWFFVNYMLVEQANEWDDEFEII